MGEHQLFEKESSQRRRFQRTRDSQNRMVSVVFLVLGCALYVTSLFLPAINNFQNNPQGVGHAAHGWEIVVTVCIPTTWILLFPFAYFLVNLSLVCSPLFFLLRPKRGCSLHFYPVALALGSLAAWSCLLWMDDLVIGYYAWAAAQTCVTIAFLIPLKIPSDSRWEEPSNAKSFGNFA